MFRMSAAVLRNLVGGFLLVAIGVGAGCNGGGGPVTPGGGGGGGQAEDLLIDFNDDPSEKLVASAKASDRVEFAIFGDKDSDGDVEKVSQIDLIVGEDGQTVTVELDEQERPVRMEADDGTATTFSYDADTGTVRADVVDASGDSTVDESFDVIAEDEPAPSRSRLGAQRALCERMESLRDVLDEFFDCDDGGGDAAFCDGTIGKAAKALRNFCRVDSTETDDLKTSLGRGPRRVPLGIRPFFTTRPAPGEGTTVILNAVAFGGARPYEKIEWLWLFGPDGVSVQNLPSGVAIADLVLPGDYVFRGEVIDADGDRVSADIEIRSESVPEVFFEWSPQRPDVGRVVTFSAEQRTRDFADEKAFYHWQFGDGEANSGPGVTHAYVEPGEYVVTLLVTTRDGRRATATEVVLVGQGPMDCGQECHDEAERLFLDCLLTGQVEDDCAKKTHDFVEACLGDGCGGISSCEDHCLQQASRAFGECVEEGGSDTECTQLTRDVAERCFREQCAQEGDCDGVCGAEAELAFERCLLEGGSDDQCAGLSSMFAEKCRAEHCGRPDDCERECKEDIGRLFEECRRNGGNEEECAARTRDFAEKCFRERCGEEGNCEQLCEDQIRQIFDQCLFDGGDDEECEHRARVFFEECRQRHCGQENGCEQECEERAGQAFGDCLQTGGTDQECSEKIRRIFDQCLFDLCGHEPDCEQLCGNEGEQAFKECRIRGGAEDQCFERAREAKEHCLVRECGGGDGGGGDECEQQCREEGDFAKRHCMDSGGDQFKCDNVFREVLEQCVQEQCRDTGNCEDRCYEQANRKFDECVINGGTTDECDFQWARVKDYCMVEVCGASGEPGDPGDCEDRCYQEANFSFDDCIANGAPAEECDILWGDVADRCLVDKCGFPEDPGGECEDSCFKHANFTFDDCVANGGAPDECDIQWQEVYDQCLRDECGMGGEPGDPGVCKNECIEEAKSVFDDCLLKGGDNDGCGSDSRAHLGSCVRDICGEEPDCGAHCLHLSNRVGENCLADGGDPVACDADASSFAERCKIAGCDG